MHSRFAAAPPSANEPAPAQRRHDDRPHGRSQACRRAPPSGRDTGPSVVFGHPLRRHDDDPGRPRGFRLWIQPHGRRDRRARADPLHPSGSRPWSAPTPHRPCGVALANPFGPQAGDDGSDELRPLRNRGSRGLAPRSSSERPGTARRPRRHRAGPRGPRCRPGLEYRDASRPRRRLGGSRWHAPRGARGRRPS